MDPLETITVTDLRLRMREIMEQVKYKGHRFRIHTFGQPTAIVISVEEYTRLVGNENHERVDARQDTHSS